jgi:exonuclease VII small subunit
MTPTKKDDGQAITKSLERLEALVRWFDEQEQVDVSEGLAKVKEGASLVKELKARLKEVENDFKDVRKELDRDAAE